MTQFYAIAKNTFIQTIRQPIFGVMIFLIFVMLVISLPLSSWTMGNAGQGGYTASDQQMLENLGLSTLLVMGLITAAFSASATISREIEDKTALTVISKPLPRSIFVFGKFSGVTLAVTLAYYLGMVVFLMTIHHKVVSNAATPINWPVVVFGCLGLAGGIFVAMAGNFMFGWAFVSTAAVTLLFTLTAGLLAMCVVDLEWNFVSISDSFSADNIRPQLLIAIFLIYMAVVMLTAVAVTASTRVGQILTLLITLTVLVAGSMHEYIVTSISYFATGVEGQQAFGANLLGWILPRLTDFYPLDALARGWEMPASVIGLKVLYFACYAGGILALGVALFQRRQIEAQGSSSSMPGTVSLISGLGRIVAIVAIIAAGVMLTQKRTYNLTSLITVAATIVAALVSWFVWSALGSGRKWSFWTISGISGILLIVGLSLWFLPSRTSFLQFTRTEAGPMMAIVGGLLLAAMLLPKTRNHFKSAS